MDEEEKQELSVTLCPPPPPKKKKWRSVFATDNREIQKKLERLSEDIQKVKDDIKKSMIWRLETSLVCRFY